jgi:hypothetical protein
LPIFQGFIYEGGEKAVFEVVLVLKPTFAGEGIPVAKTDNPEAVAAVKSAIVTQAVKNVALWELDPAAKRVAMAELKRLREILSLEEEDKPPVS